MVHFIVYTDNVYTDSVYSDNVSTNNLDAERVPDGNEKGLECARKYLRFTP